MNWAKIIGNFLTAFCTAAIAVDFVAGPQAAIAAGIIVAFLHGGLAVGAELQEEANNPLYPIEEKAQICPENILKCLIL